MQPNIKLTYIGDAYEAEKRKMYALHCANVFIDHVKLIGNTTGKHIVTLSDKTVIDIYYRDLLPGQTPSVLNITINVEQISDKGKEFAVEKEGFIIDVATEYGQLGLDYGQGTYVEEEPSYTTVERGVFLNNKTLRRHKKLKYGNVNWVGGKDSKEFITYWGSPSRYGALMGVETEYVYYKNKPYQFNEAVLGAALARIDNDLYIIAAHRVVRESEVYYPADSFGTPASIGDQIKLVRMLISTKEITDIATTPIPSREAYSLAKPVYFSVSGKKCITVIGGLEIEVVLNDALDEITTTFRDSGHISDTDLFWYVSYKTHGGVIETPASTVGDHPIAVDYRGETVVRRVITVASEFSWTTVDFTEIDFHSLETTGTIIPDPNYYPDDYTYNYSTTLCENKGQLILFEDLRYDDTAYFYTAQRNFAGTYTGSVDWIPPDNSNNTTGSHSFDNYHTVDWRDEIVYKKYCGQTLLGSKTTWREYSFSQHHWWILDPNATFDIGGWTPPVDEGDDRTETVLDSDGGTNLNSPVPLVSLNDYNWGIILSSLPPIKYAASLEGITHCVHPTLGTIKSILLGSDTAIVNTATDGLDLDRPPLNTTDCNYTLITLGHYKTIFK